jgi:hypothetical protein
LWLTSWLVASQKKHEWLKQIPKKLGNPWITLAIMLAFSAAMMVGYDMNYNYRHGPKTYDREPLEDWQLAVTLIVETSANAVSTLLYAVSQLQLGPRYFNFTNSVWKTLNGAAYTTYLIHFWFVELMAYFYVKLLSLDDWYPEFNDDRVPGSSNPLPSDWLILAGIAFIFVFANVVTWPLSIFIKRLPGFKDIL